MASLTGGEAASVRFVFARPGALRARYAVAFALFVGALALVATGQHALSWLPLLIFGHLLLWVRGLKTAPGGATPEGEQTWAPVEPDWQQRVSDLETAGERWDTSPWDISSAAGFGVLLVALLFASMLAGFPIAGTVDTSMVLFAVVALLPLWLNGMRTTWNPSELRLKGEALQTAETIAKSAAGDRLEPVPLLALRPGARGSYPVDARLMLRPQGAGADEPFIGIQVQVAINNVRGQDYPYLYCVILMKEGHQPPEVDVEMPGDATSDVTEVGGGDGVSYVVVRQHADDNGGWHTGVGDIERVVTTAVRATEKL